MKRFLIFKIIALCIVSCSKPKTPSVDPELPPLPDTKSLLKLNKSSLKVKDTEDLSLWRHYSKPVEPFALHAPSTVAFSTDGRMMYNITIYKDHSNENDFDMCNFYVVGKMTSTKENNVEKILLGEVEFIFSWGHLNFRETSKPKRSSIDDGHKHEAEIEKYCFENLTLEDLRDVLKPDEKYPQVNLGRIISRSNDEAVFGVHAPTGKSSQEVPKQYVFPRLNPQAWVKDQRCDEPGSDCLD